MHPKCSHSLVEECILLMKESPSCCVVLSLLPLLLINAAILHSRLQHSSLSNVVVLHDATILPSWGSRIIILPTIGIAPVFSPCSLFPTSSFMFYNSMLNKLWESVLSNLLDHSHILREWHHAYHTILVMRNIFSKESFYEPFLLLLLTISLILNYCYLFLTSNILTFMVN